MTLQVDEHLSYVSLGLRHPGAATPTEVAWDDQAHWHPHVLRWEELDLVGRSVALADPELPHPGLVVLLLCRFAPVCLGEDVDIILPLLETAWRSLGMLSDRQMDRRIERLDHRQGQFTWRFQESLGWTLHQDEGARDSSGHYLYTLRAPESGEFPFAD